MSVSVASMKPQTSDSMVCFAAGAWTGVAVTTTPGNRLKYILYHDTRRPRTSFVLRPEPRDERCLVPSLHRRRRTVTLGSRKTMERYQQRYHLQQHRFSFAFPVAFAILFTSSRVDKHEKKRKASPTANAEKGNTKLLKVARLLLSCWCWCCCSCWGRGCPPFDKTRGSEYNPY